MTTERHHSIREVRAHLPKHFAHMSLFLDQFRLSVRNRIKPYHPAIAKGFIIMLRDNFKPWQKEEALEFNAHRVLMTWPEFKANGQRYYMCENEECRFVSSNSRLFEVDHVVSCKQGGTASREPINTILKIELERRKPLDRQDIAVLAHANWNAQVLCKGCNQAKKGSGPRPDDIPKACGYAYAKPDLDANPDHRYAGLPPVSGPVKLRYRKNLPRT